MTSYYIDGDGDGWGTGTNADYCEGFQPVGWVPNDEDTNDSIYCESNAIDRCDVCDGADECVDCNDIPWGAAFLDNCNQCSGGNTNHEADSDIDCNGDCFGTAYLDDCSDCSEGNTQHIANSAQDCEGVCDGNAIIDDCNNCAGLNQSCLDDIFQGGPLGFTAIIQDDGIDINWDQPNYPEEVSILGFHVYLQNGDNLELLATTVDEFFYDYQNFSGTFCVAAYDQFNNESQLNCIEATEQITFCWDLIDGANLISLPAVPEDSSITIVFSDLMDQNIIDGLISQSLAAYLLSNGVWVGSLLEIENILGYWMIMDLPFNVNNYEWCVSGLPTDPSTIYPLSSGANLISYVGEEGMALSEAIPDEFESSFQDVISASVAAYNHPVVGWLGSLTHLYHGVGYWVKLSESIDFHWTLPTLSREVTHDLSSLGPNPFKYNQSSQQAFYFIENVQGIELSDDDYLIAYCNGNIVGNRKWNGEYTDIPAMGNDGFDYSQGYCENGQIPEFKLYHSHNDEWINLEGENIPQWSTNELHIISLSVSQTIEIPVETTIQSVYPNPFNPETQIQFQLQQDDQITLSIFDLNGREIIVLINQYLSAGEHQLRWNAAEIPSGMYILQLTTSNHIDTHKILLLK